MKMILDFIDNNGDTVSFPPGAIAEMLCDAALETGRAFCIRRGADGSMLFDYGMGNATGEVLAVGHAPAGADAIECEAIIRRAVAEIAGAPVAAEWTSHDVIRLSDGKSIGSISALWHDHDLVKAQRIGNVPRGVVELFRMDITPRAMRAHGKYVFRPPVN
jgi:hypothetical protein